jgi:hypothetical protein
MRGPEIRELAVGSDAPPIPDGFGKPEAKPGPSSQRDPGTVRPVDLTPDAKAMKLGARERKRHESVTLPVSPVSWLWFQVRFVIRLMRPLWAAQAGFAAVRTALRFRLRPAPRPAGKA